MVEGETLMTMPIQILMLVAVAQWLLFALTSIVSRSPMPKGAKVRPPEKRLLISSAVLAGAWLLVFGMPEKSGTVAAAAIAPSSVHGSCSMLEPGMSAETVATKVGQPDEKKPDEEVRGPGAQTWVYRDSRCAVHLFDGKVEAID